MPSQGMDIKLTILAKSTCRPQMVGPDKFSCSLLRSSYQNTQKHAITGSEDEVDIFVKIDMLTLNGWSEQIFLVRTEFLIL